MPKILIAEDDPSMRSMMSDYLEFKGFEIGAAENGEDALELWDNDKYDILITDINMPKMNGFDLLKKIRLSNEALPVVMISGVFLESVETQAKEVGVNKLMYKPFKMSLLYDAVMTLLKI